MKTVFKVAIVAMFMLFVGNFAKAQAKIGYVNFDDIVRLMPEFKTAQTTIDGYQKQFIDQLTAMNTEYTTKGKEYQAQQATMTDAIRTAKQTELADIQKRMTDYQENARQQVEAKTNELLKPITDKVKDAVTAVAKEKGYTFVYNSSQTQSLVIVAPDGDDITAATKLKLGVK
jgi:outer membrane protein